MSTDADAFFLPEAEDRFVSTEWTRGPWSPELQHGGPSAALLGRAIERRIAAEAPGARVARIAIEFVRPIPIAPLRVRAEVVRAGKKVQVVAASLEAAGKEIARATAVSIRVADVGAEPRGAGAAPRAPGLCAPFEFPFFPDVNGYHRAMEARLARGTFGTGALAVWFRVRVALVAGEPISPLARVLAAADSGNGISVLLDLRKFTFVNPDLTVHLHRLPAGEWVCMDAFTTAQPDGIGLSDTALSDEAGAIGRSLQSLIVERRDAPG